jgi:site-specific recombinase XerD
MAIKWIKTNHKGLRYYEHKDRKHGKQRDRYYSIYFKVDKNLYTYGIGWMSDGIPEAILREEPGIGFQDYCLKLLRLYKNNVKTGSGPQSPKETRMIAAEDRKQIDDEKKRTEKENISFSQFMTDTYLPQSKLDKKAKTHEIESMLYERHMADIIGPLPFGNISAFHLEKIKKTMGDKKLSNRTIQYVLQIIRHVFKKAKDGKIFNGDSPTKAVKWPKLDNMKMRYLSIDEAEKLLAALATKSQSLHDSALLSLHCGLRFGEIAALPWSCVNLETGTLAILNAKTGSRTAYLTERAKTMLEARKQSQKEKAIGKARKQSQKEKNEFVFPKRSGKEGIMAQASKVFRDTLDELKLNDGITDRKQRVTFHTLRHTYATHLYESTHDLYLTQRSLGHSTSTMTQRYAKMSESRLREGAEALEKAFSIIKGGH